MENIRKFKCQSVMPTRANIYLLEDQKERRQFMDIKSHRDNRKKISKKKKKTQIEGLLIYRKNEEVHTKGEL